MKLFFLHAFNDGCHNATEIPDKPPIKGRQAMETANFTHNLGCWPLMNCPHLLFINLNAFSTHHKPQKQQIIGHEATFLQTDITYFPAILLGPLSSVLHVRIQFDYISKYCQTKPPQIYQ